MNRTDDNEAPEEWKQYLKRTTQHRQCIAHESHLLGTHESCVLAEHLFGDQKTSTPCIKGMWFIGFPRDECYTTLNL